MTPTEADEGCAIKFWTIVVLLILLNAWLGFPGCVQSSDDYYAPPETEWRR